jgi:hypothetical protein
MLRSAIFGAVLAVGVAVTALLVNGTSGQEMVPVRLADRMLSVAANEVTVAQWQACSDAGACEDHRKTRWKCWPLARHRA